MKLVMWLLAMLVTAPAFAVEGYLIEQRQLPPVAGQVVYLCTYRMPDGTLQQIQTAIPYCEFSRRF